MNAFMSVVHGLQNRDRGLDLILHTLGGDIAASESIMQYLKQMFNSDIRTFVPQIAMSAGTSIACASKEIWMGKQSSLGPIDPQIFIPGQGYAAAMAILEEFESVQNLAKSDPDLVALAQVLISRFPLTLVVGCQSAVEWSRSATKENLEQVMFASLPNASDLATTASELLCDHRETKSHSRHLGIDYCRDKLKLKVQALEQDNTLQDLVLSIHHAYMLTFASTDAVKIVENNLGNAYVTGSSE